MDTTRRALLRTGAVGVAGLATLAGCLDESGDADDGLPPESDDPPAERDVDTDSFDTLSERGQEVPLVPLDVAYYWYRRREARYVDARGQRQYEAVRITGAVHSPAPTGRTDDPVDDWPADARIVTYCGCPHHLSSQRAATLLNAGYEEVYAIDEGLVPWVENGYPISGEQTDEFRRVGTIEGEAPDAEAGAYAWAWHDPSGQREAAPIDADGRYELEIRFSDVDERSPIRVETPTYEVEAPLGELSEGVVTGRDR